MVNYVLFFCIILLQDQAFQCKKSLILVDLTSFIRSSLRSSEALLWGYFLFFFDDLLSLMRLTSKVTYLLFFFMASTGRMWDRSCSAVALRTMPLELVCSQWSFFFLQLWTLPPLVMKLIMHSEFFLILPFYI